MVYIPDKHKKYKLLPHCTKHGGEAFSYPTGLEDEIAELLPKGLRVIPYGYKSYAEYYSMLDDYISKYGTTDGTLNKLGMLISEYKACVQKRNVKENWSIVRYMGSSNLNFTHGRYYYCPCYIESPEYEGVIDNEEFTSYLAFSEPSFLEAISEEISTSVLFYEPADEKLKWEIVEDPTGILAKYFRKK